MKRKFKVNVPVLLTTAKTVANNLESNHEAFLADNPQWTPEWIAEYRERIDRINTKVGIKSTEEQRKATLALKEITAKVIDDLSLVKTQIERGFRNNKLQLNELLEQLGFHRYWTKVSSQNSLLDLLYAFDNHTNEALCNELTAQNVAIARIQSIKACAAAMTAANVTQETLKSTAPALTAEQVAELNEIYSTAIDICLVGQRLFKKDPVRKAQFSFAKLAAQQGVTNKKKENK